jgi:hypothetical protein
MPNPFRHLSAAERGQRLGAIRDRTTQLAGYQTLSKSQVAESEELREQARDLIAADFSAGTNGITSERGSIGNDDDDERRTLGSLAAGSDADRHTLAYTRQALDALQAAIETRTPGRFFGADTEERAALTTSTFGAPRVWGSNVLGGPRLLHAVAGVPVQPSDAINAAFPVLTLPSAGASVGENVTLAEFAASTAGSATMGRYGRFTDMSRESRFGTDAGAIVSLHRIGIAKDLDSNLIGLVNTAAGAAVAFTADVPAAIRKAMAGVVDATAAADVSALTILVNPADASLLQSVTPTGGQTIAEMFQNFSGALVYPSSAVPTGFMLVANLQAGVRYYEAQGVVTETDIAVKTSTYTIATSVIGAYGLGLAGGAFAKVDVVTP